MPRENETTKDLQEVRAEHDKLFKTDLSALESKLMRIGNGEHVESDPNPHSKGEIGSLIDADADNPENGYQAEHIDFGSIFNKLGLKAQSPQQKKVTGKTVKVASAPQEDSPEIECFEPLLNDLVAFKFSSSNRDREITALREALQKEMKNIVSQRIFSNTRKISSDIRKFYYLKPHGLQVEFSLLNQKFAMSVLGEFTGDECLCWQANGNKIIGHVMRMTPDGGFENISEGFKISVAEGWKE